MKVYTFGDSWAHGAELNEGEKTFGDIIADKFNVPHVLAGMSGSSLAEVMDAVTHHIDDITENDFVYVVIPPDIRWYNVSSCGTVKTMMTQSEEWTKAIIGKDIQWFIYHHSLFIFAIISMLRLKGCKFILCHNYGALELHPRYKSMIDCDNTFLDKNNSLTMLLTDRDWKDNYNRNFKWDGPAPSLFVGKYFEGNLFHPNQLGHERIAELLLERMNNVK